MATHGKVVPIEWNGVRYGSIAEAARSLGISRQAMHQRLSKGALSDYDIRCLRGKPGRKTKIKNPLPFDPVSGEEIILDSVPEVSSYRLPEPRNHPYDSFYKCPKCRSIEWTEYMTDEVEELTTGDIPYHVIICRQCDEVFWEEFGNDRVGEGE